MCLNLVRPANGANPPLTDRRIIEMTNNAWYRRWALLLIVLSGAFAQTACGYLAAGAAGAAIGHEAAENDDDDD